MAADAKSYDATTWFAGTAALPPPRARLNYDLDADVCVIGGGLAGLTAAREVARRGWSVVVLEARRIASSASGCNSGVVLPGFSASLEGIVDRLGAEAARGLWRLSQTGIDYIRETIAEAADGTGEAAIVDSRGFIDVAKWPDAGVAARIALLAAMGTEAEAWPVERVRAVLRTSHYFGGVFFPGAFSINPVAYAARLTAAALDAGVRIFENTEVTAVDLAGVRKRITTPNVRVRCSDVVLAGNVRLAGIVPSLAGTIIPVDAHVGITRPLGERLGHAIAFTGAVTPSRLRRQHYRVVGGDRLMWSGTASPLLARRSLERAIMTTYPQIGGVRFEYFSSAPMGFAVHGMPQIGELSRGVWVAAAFGGQGLNTSAMAGILIARAIVERDDAWRRFLPFELVWAGGRTGRTVVGAATLWRRGGEAAHALLARQREEFRRMRAEPPAHRKKPETPDSPFAAARIANEVSGKLKQLTLPAAAESVPGLKWLLNSASGKAPVTGPAPPDSDAGKPGTAKSETAKSETAKPETAMSETARSETAMSETVGSDTAGSDADATAASRTEVE